MRKNEAYIFDLDGTLADCEHRRHWIATKPKNWKAFFAGIPNDPVIEWVATVARRTFERGEIDVVIVTARDEWFCRTNTVNWLKDNGIRYDAIYFRPDKDYRDDTLVKHEIYHQVKADGFRPVLVFDDRPKVIRTWRNLGLIVIDCGDGVEF